MGVNVYPTPANTALPVGASSLVYTGSATSETTVNLSAGKYAAITWSADQTQAVTSIVGVNFVNENIYDSLSGNTANNYDTTVLITLSSPGSIKYMPTPNTQLLTSIVPGPMLYGDNQWLAFSKASTTRFYTSTAHPVNDAWTQRAFTTNTIVTDSAFGSGETEKYVITVSGTNPRSSTDGITWTARTVGGFSITTVCYGNGSYVGLGNDGTNISYAISTNGVTWTTGATTGGNLAMYTAEYLNGNYVGGGGNGALVYSTNGTTWTATTVDLSGSNPNIYGLAYGDGVYVLVGTQGAIGTSTDLVTWTSRTSGVTQTIWSVVHDGNDFYAFSEGSNWNSILKSTDGITWEKQFSQYSLSTSNLTIYADSKIVTQTSTNQMRIFQINNPSQNPTSLSVVKYEI